MEEGIDGWREMDEGEGRRDGGREGRGMGRREEGMLEEIEEGMNGWRDRWRKG